MTVHFITSNQHKWKETYPLLSPVVHLVRTTLELQEIQAASLEEIVLYKLKQAYKHVQKAVICEDTALYIEELGGFPGPYIKYFINQVGLERIGKLVGGSLALAHTCYGYYDGKEPFFFHGKVSGRLLKKVKGENNPFGFTPLFVPESSQMTYAEMSFEEKQAYSQRVKALKKMKAYFTSKEYNNNS